MAQASFEPGISRSRVRYAKLARQLNMKGPRQTIIVICSSSLLSVDFVKNVQKSCLKNLNFVKRESLISHLWYSFCIYFHLSIFASIFRTNQILSVLLQIYFTIFSDLCTSVNSIDCIILFFHYSSSNNILDFQQNRQRGFFSF